MKHLFVIITVLLCISFASSLNSSQNFDANYWNDIEHKMKVARVMTWGGLALRTLSVYLPPELSALATIGGASYLIGLPYMGNTTDKALFFAYDLGLNVEELESRGWRPYRWGWVTQGLGIAGYITSLLYLFDFTESDFITGTLIIIGSTLVYVTGRVLHLVSWYKFSDDYKRVEFQIRRRLSE